MKRRTALALIATLPLASSLRAQARDGVPKFLENADALESLKTVIVSVEGKEVATRAYHGASLNGSTNIKSASKSIVSSLVGIAIDRKILDGVDQPISSVLRSDFPAKPDPRIERVTIGNLLSMQSGLERMSGPNYGRWVSSRNWVRMALGSGFAGEPGGGMLYSTGSTHLLSAILTKASGKSTLALARDWFSPLDGFSIGSWERDPQGIYLGGNQMAMTAASLLAFGDLYRNGGKTKSGRQVVSQSWIDQSWMPRTNSRFSGDGYGYGWFLRQIGVQDVKFGWGYGGQMVYVVPALDMTVVMTSKESGPSARNGYRDQLHDLLAEIIGAVASA
jgi:CubicO group peptidase (beta-lactamase class C family)